jgi:hypothetical protein
MSRDRALHQIGHTGTHRFTMPPRLGPHPPRPARRGGNTLSGSRPVPSAGSPRATGSVGSAADCERRPDRTMSSPAAGRGGIAEGRPTSADRRRARIGGRNEASDRDSRGIRVTSSGQRS